jgi:hypothetical protein
VSRLLVPVGVVVVACIIRMALFESSTISDVLAARFELATPLSSFRRCESCSLSCAHVTVTDLSVCPVAQ